jgi:2-(1,2-epoxy-1,2-dihydrophenyl)acetyl-CoA isomerase
MTTNTSESSPVLFSVANGIGLITLNRPKSLNAINKALAEALLKSLDECKDPLIRCVCLTGASDFFCAGQDLMEASASSPEELGRKVGELYNPVIRAIQELEKPVVAAVNGPAAGAGANIALCCDIVIASDNAYFLQAFTNIGLIPDSGGTYYLPRLIGWQKASALMLLADKLPAADAERMGMIHKVFPQAEFLQKRDDLTTRLAKMPTKALALTKQALIASLTNDLTLQLDTEAENQKLALMSADFKEGTQAFFEKRKPNFIGA